MFNFNRIEINLDTLRATIKAYDNCIYRLDNNISSINNSVIKLKDGWSGKAEVAFFETHHNEWDRGMKEQLSHLTFLRDQLKIVLTEFEELKYESDRLKLDF